MLLEKMGYSILNKPIIHKVCSGGKTLDEKILKRDLILGVMVIALLPALFLLKVYLAQGLQGIKDWLVPISGYVSLITIAIGSWVVVNDYRLKIDTEKRMSDISLVESDVKLLKLFSEIMEIAHCRHDPIVSEKVIDGLFQKDIITAMDYNSPIDNGPAEKKLKTAILIPAYGTASQDAAIAAVYALGKKHEILLDSAIEGLKAIDGFVVEKEDPKKKEMLKKFIEELNEHKKQTLIKS